jgi:AcrR family transcriptional regulator
MPEPVKTKRAYNSPRRQEQAAATRRAILESAQQLFEQQGYAATTMDAIAAETGVALKTVYSAFVTKSRLLRALWDFLLKGDQDDAGVAERPWYREVLEERDPERKLRLNAHYACIVKRRIAGLLEVIRSAAAVDADSATLWALIQRLRRARQRQQHGCATLS